MTQQETYGNWLGPKRLVRQPGIYSVAGKMSPLGDFRPASPDSFEDDYDDVSMAGSERGPPAKGVYLLAGPPGSSPAPSLKNSQDFEPKLQDLGPKLQDSDPKSANLDLKSGDLDPNWGVSRPGAWNSVTVSLLVLLGLSGLAWAALLGLGLAEQQELRAELELLRSNVSAIWDSVQQDQTRLQFGIHQHQQELQEITALLCGSGVSSRPCPPGWTFHGSSCFSFSRDSLGWGRARNACTDLGAHLAVVSSEDEQVFLTKNRDDNSSYWLGVRERQGRMRWVTGEEPKFGFWDVWGQDGDKERRECGALGPRGRWIRRGCSEFHRWICEKPGSC
ncbi:CD209 antigen-like protein E isoform X2 [Chamaea fasciata]|uniref:CD209 antigen-like protein E isoform X2 n=1 Tax=Chamaea fasciata TaxID=190680 RepID=UPI00336AE857